MGTVRDSVTGASTARSLRTFGAEMVVVDPAYDAAGSATIGYDAPSSKAANSSATRPRIIAEG